ncbi:hypothetical protein RJ639_001631 [Escallonia herrerae]|uniref:Reverse transcriptase Ty1/copia-type domain-containing protein n=1 Tax=Escallonia herrerae TaxID=1293975 RepID=A0AA89BJ91_9ASTE|nr:hypothetical protein RJ639_001631 [Escallonia herrerae]
MGLFPQAKVRGNCVKMFDDFKKEMAKEFEMTDIGSMSYYLGIEMEQKKKPITLTLTEQSGRESSRTKEFDSISMKCNMAIEAGVMIIIYYKK